MFFLLQSIVTLNISLLESIKSDIKDLHRKTKYKTYYEMFNISENCEQNDLKKKFRKLMKSKDTFGLERSEYEMLVNKGYQILLKHQKEYDYLLNLKFIDILKQDFKLYLISTIFMGITSFIFCDIFYLFLKYLKLKMKKQNLSKNEYKKFIKKNGEIVDFNFRNLISFKIIKFIFRL